MKQIPWQPVAALCGAVTLIALVACGEDATESKVRNYVSPAVAVGAGMARSELVFDSGNKLRSVSVVFSEGALNSLPAATTEFIIPLPTDAPGTAINHLGINWQPTGHPPPMVYTVPHFDVHYYLVPISARDAMVPSDPNFAAKATKAPTAEEAPPGYVADAFGIPRMGTHWTDPTSHEFHGSAFTSTLVYGYFDGKMIFLEPMMTKAFLESKPNETKAIRPPARYPAPGQYPTNYRIAHDATAKEYRIELLDFVARN